MKIWRGRRWRAASTCFGLALVAVFSSPGWAGAAGDPDDVGTGLDLKSVSHTEQAGSIVYTAETYTDFPDNLAAFKWGIDTDGDESFDLIAFAQWEGGKLVAGVNDPGGKRVAAATASRPAGNAIAISVPSSVLAGVTAYRYSVVTKDDRNGNGKDDPGEQDLAPNSGLYGHALGTAPTSAVPAPGRVAAAVEEETGAEAPVARPPEPRTGLPRTGAGGRLLSLLAGGLLLAGGVSCMAETTVPRRRAPRVTGPCDEEE